MCVYICFKTSRSTLEVTTIQTPVFASDRYSQTLNNKSNNNKSPQERVRGSEHNKTRICYQRKQKQQQYVIIFSKSRECSIVSRTFHSLANVWCATCEQALYRQTSNQTINDFQYFYTAEIT